MTNEFCQAFLFVNQTVLKRYLANCEISLTPPDELRNPTLSDNGYGGLLFFKRDVSLERIKSYCCLDDYEVGVVIKVLLNKSTEVTPFSENGAGENGPLGENEDATAFLVKESIPFANVFSIAPVDGEIVFLQGDSTINAPDALIQEKSYSPASPLSEEAVTAILDAVISSTGSKQSQTLDILDDEDDTSDFVPLQMEEAETPTISSNEEENPHDKLLAGLLMLAQGAEPITHKLTADLHAILDGENSFKDCVETNFYPDAPEELSACLAKPNDMIVRFMNDLENSARKAPSSGSLFSSAIKSLLKADVNREQFEKDFLEGIKDPKAKEKAETCLRNPRARDMIATLKNEASDMLPIYMLYVFFDYGFDKLNENAKEFGLAGTKYPALLFALWGLKNGTSSIYEEYKDPEIVYACEAKVSHWLGTEGKLVPVDTFLKVNKITLQENERLIANFRCSYINIKVEYASLYAEANKKVIKDIEKLEKDLKKAFGPRFAPFEEALKKHKAKGVDLTPYVSEIHKNYLASLKKAKAKAKAKEKEPKWEQGKLL